MHQNIPSAFKQQRNIMKTQVGKDVLNTFITHTPDYTAAGVTNAQKTAMRDTAFERWCAYIFLQNSDQSKYGSLVEGLQSQYSLKNNQYPTTVTDALGRIIKSQVGSSVSSEK